MRVETRDRRGEKHGVRLENLQQRVDRFRSFENGKSLVPIFGGPEGFRGMALFGAAWFEPYAATEKTTCFLS